MNKNNNGSESLAYRLVYAGLLVSFIVQAASKNSLIWNYEHGTAKVEDINQDGREDISIADESGKRIQFYISTDAGYIQKDKYLGQIREQNKQKAEQEEQKISQLEAELK